MTKVKSTENRGKNGPQPVVTDVSGSMCPIPVIRLNATIAKVRPGDRVMLICTDPVAEVDIKTWCIKNRHTLIGITKKYENGYVSSIQFLIRKSSSPSPGAAAANDGTS